MKNYKSMGITKQSQILSSVAALWFSCATMPAQAISLGSTGAEVRAYEYDRTTSDPWIVDVHNTSATGPASYNTAAFAPATPVPGGGTGRAPGSETAAYAGSDGVKAYATAAVNRTASSYASLGDTYIVSSGAYTTGTAVTLDFSLRLDGVLDVSTYQNSESAWVGVDGSFRLQDPTIGEDGEGFIVTPLVEFNSNISYQEDHSTYWGTTYNSYDARWDLYQNDVWVDGDLTQSYSETLDNQISSCLPGSTGNCIKGFDTGVLSLSVDTYVGANLQWVADLSLFLQAYEEVDSPVEPGTGHAYTYADFGDTFALSLTSSDPNVWLDGTYPLNASVVPVPAAVWLFGSGLIGLIGVAGRKSHV